MGTNLSSRINKIKPSSTLGIQDMVIKLKKEGKDIVSFTVGQPDFNTPKYICDAAKTAIDDGYTKYTEVAGFLDLRIAICDKLLKENNIKYTPSQIVCSNGGKHSLMNTFFVILDDGDEVLIPTPYWLSYPAFVKLAGGNPIFIDTNIKNNYKVTVKELEQYITANTKALIINSPSNPTGVMYTEKELRDIADFVVKHDIFLISDEIYEDLVYDDIKHISIASLNEEIYKRTITINGFSKSYAMTGWRLGYLAASEEIAKAVTKIQGQQTSNPSSITQKAAYAALVGDQSEKKYMIKAFKNRRELMYKELDKISGINYIKPNGAFYVFVDFSNFIGKYYKDILLKDAQDIADILVKYHMVATIPCADFGAKNHIRLSYAISDDNIKKGIARIADFCKEINNGRS